jgi:hypothetical protein
MRLVNQTYWTQVVNSACYSGPLATVPPHPVYRESGVQRGRNCGDPGVAADRLISLELAEGEGFEPPLPFRVKRFSRPPVSTAHTSLRGSGNTSVAMIRRWPRAPRKSPKRLPGCAMDTPVAPCLPPRKGHWPVYHRHSQSEKDGRVLPANFSHTRP